MKKVIYIVTTIVVLLVISVVLGFIWVSQRAGQVKESKKNAFTQKYESCVEQIKADYPNLELISANYNGMECVSFYCSEEISVAEQINITYEIFKIIRQKSYELYGNDTDEAVSVKIASQSYNYFKIDNGDIGLRFFTNCKVNENELQEIITEDFKIVKESEK